MCYLCLSVHLYEQGDDPSGDQENTLNMVAEFDLVDEPHIFQASDTTKIKTHSAFQVHPN
jgi:hypothetical protein